MDKPKLDQITADDILNKYKQMVEHCHCLETEFTTGLLENILNSLIVKNEPKINISP